jgi:hypothetical protein
MRDRGTERSRDRVRPEERSQSAEGRRMDEERITAKDAKNAKRRLRTE